MRNATRQEGVKVIRRELLRRQGREGCIFMRSQGLKINILPTPRAAGADSMIIGPGGQKQESAPDPPTQGLPQAKYPDDAKAADFPMFPMFQLHSVSYYRGRWIHPCVNYIRSRHIPCVFKFRRPVPIPSWEIHGSFSLLAPTCLCYCLWPAYRVIVNQARAQAHRDAHARQALIVAP